MQEQGQQVQQPPLPLPLPVRPPTAATDATTAATTATILLLLRLLYYWYYSYQKYLSNPLQTYTTLISTTASASTTSTAVNASSAAMPLNILQNSRQSHRSTRLPCLFTSQETGSVASICRKASVKRCSVASEMDLEITPGKPSEERNHQRGWKKQKN